MQPLRLATALLAGALLCAPAPLLAAQVNEQLSIQAELLAAAVVSEVDGEGGYTADRAQAGLRFQASGADQFRFTAEQAGAGSAATIRDFHWAHNITPLHVVRAGIQPSPLVEKDERSFWGERLAAPAFAEYWGLAPAADLGIGVFGNASGVLDYHLLAANGEGYGQPKQGDGQALSGRVGLFDGTWELGGAWYEEVDHNGVAGYDPHREIVYLFYHGQSVTLGGQWLQADDGSSTGFSDADGYNVEGRLDMGGEGELFGRFDQVETGPQRTRQSLIVVGFTGHPANGVTLAPTVVIRDHGSYDDTRYALYARFAF